MVKLFNKETEELLGRVSEEDLEFLGARLEKEGLEDRDYFVRKETVEGFRGLGGSEHLVEVLLGGMRDLPTMEIRWERDKEG